MNSGKLPLDGSAIIFENNGLKRGDLMEIAWQKSSSVFSFIWALFSSAFFAFLVWRMAQKWCKAMKM